MSLRTTRRRTLARLGVLGLVALTSVGLAAPAASAAPAATTRTPVTVPLDPAEVELSLRPHENVGVLDYTAPFDATALTPAPVDMFWQAAARIHFPAQLETGDLRASLALSPTPDAEPTRVYASDSADPADQLQIDDLGEGWYDVIMPVHDGVSGPHARLTYTGIAPAAGTGAGVTVIEPLTYRYRFTSDWPGGVQYATPQLIASARVPCAVNSAEACSVGSVAAGTSLSLPVPAASRLRALGLGDPQAAFAAVSIYRLDDSGNPSVPWGVTQDSVDVNGRVVTIPSDTPAGRYRVYVSMGVPRQVSGTQTTYPSELSITRFDVEVTAALNEGLRSNTGWVEPATDADGGVSPLVFLGAGMVAAAGLTTAVVLRPRRRAAGK